jgi:two-component sensor histidine kinase
MRYPILLWLILFNFSAFGAILVPDVTHINEPVKLAGEWGFAEGKALFPQQTYPVTKTLYLPQYLEDRNGSKGVATFFIDLKTTPGKALSIDFNPLVNPWKLFVDNRLIYESGTIDPVKGIYLASPKRHVANFIPTETKTRLTLWVANSQHRHFGLGVSPVIAPEEILEASHESRKYFDLVIISILLAFGFYHIGLFFAWRGDRTTLWFGLFLIAFAVRIAATGEKTALLWFDSMSWETLTRTEYISGYLTIPLFILYIGSLYQKQSIKKIEYLNVGVGVLFVLSALFMPTLFFTSMLPLAEIIILQSLVFIAWILYRAYRDKEPYSIFAFVAFGIFSLTVFHDVLMFSKIIDAAQDLAPVGFVFYLFAQTHILLRRYANAFHTLQKNENELEHLIAKRTAELRDLLSQRELLMRELSHRVKNNLQFILGLIWTKRSKTSSETQAILLSLQSQIQAIATVHEALCSQVNITSVNGGEYLNTVLDALQELYPHIPFKYTCKSSGFLSADDIVSLGLIVSELISNSVKHAFSDRNGTITIEFSIENNTAILIYSDGLTLFENNNFIAAFNDTKRMGWSMIVELIRQLQAQTIADDTLFSLFFTADKTR